jgi:hypothetical protein
MVGATINAQTTMNNLNLNAISIDGYCAGLLLGAMYYNGSSFQNIILSGSITTSTDTDINASYSGSIAAFI